MRIVRALTICFLISLPAFAQTYPDPVILSIVPAGGTSDGATTVTITGNHLGLPPNFACLLPCPAKVLFDNTAATMQSESDTALIVTTPPHAAGGVDVTVITGDNRRAIASNAFFYTSQQESAYERLLIPILLEDESAGSNGSLWKTQLWLRNNATTTVALAPWVCPLGALCIPGVLTRNLQPGESLLNLPSMGQTNPGRILYVTRDGAPAVSADLRLFELSQSDTDAGTEIPVIRESELLTAPAHLQAVPLDARFRLTLRIYELGVDDAQFRVRVFRQAEGADMTPPILELEPRALTTVPAGFRTQPAYAEYGTLTDLLNTPQPQPDSVRVDIEPLTAGSHYWAFVSVTNNETQRVTLITPQ